MLDLPPYMLDPPSSSPSPSPSPSPSFLLSPFSHQAASVGLGWSKDNLRLRNFGWSTSALQTALAAMSLGPVGLADRLEGFPHAPPLVNGSYSGASVSTNVTLATATCTANGTLLQPSHPLVPVGDMLAGVAPLGTDRGHVWTTYTAIPTGTTTATTTTSATAAPDVQLWYTALSFAHEGVPAGTYFSLHPHHLGEIVDISMPTPTLFGAVPRGSFEGDGFMLGPAPATNPHADDAVSTRRMSVHTLDRTADMRVQSKLVVLGHVSWVSDTLLKQSSDASYENSDLANKPREYAELHHRTTAPPHHRACTESCTLAVTSKVLPPPTPCTPLHHSLPCLLEHHPPGRPKPR
jgi:hypothetical protein